MKKIFKVSYERTIELSQKDIDDLITDAFEGGINYWCGKVEVKGEYKEEYASDQISRGGTLILYDRETDNKWELTLEKFLNGIKLWAENSSGDIENTDGDDADQIIQYALFEKIVFG